MSTQIDKTLCNGCGRCIERCGMFVYTRSFSSDVILCSPRKCADCTLCVSGCPQKAITMFFPGKILHKRNQ